MYFVDCPACGAEVKVPALELKQRKYTKCRKCEAEIVFADVTLKEGRILVVIRCPYLDCAHHDKEQWVRLTRSFLKRAVSGGDDRVYCQYCHRTFRLTDLEKKNTAKMLDDEAAQEAAC